MTVRGSINRHHRAVRAAAGIGRRRLGRHPGRPRRSSMAPRRRSPSSRRSPCSASLIGFGIVDRAVLPADVGQVPRPDLRPRLRVRRRRASPRATRRSRTASCSRPPAATVAVFAVMLVLYRTNIIKVTNRFRKAVIFATLGIMVMYGVSFDLHPVRRQRRVHQLAVGVRHRVQRGDLRRRLVEPRARLRLHREGRPRRTGQGLRVVRRLRVCSSPSSGCTSSSCACSPSSTRGDAGRPAAVALCSRPLAVAGGGGALAAAAWWRSASAPSPALVGAANGALAGHHRIYRWRTRTGPLAFVLDSTWALPTTAAALLAHAVAALQRRPGNYVAELSERCDRHVYVARADRASAGSCSRSATSSTAPAPTCAPRRGGDGSSPTTSTSTCGRRGGSARCSRCGYVVVDGRRRHRRRGRVGARRPARAVRQVGRDVRLLPQPVRVVGLQPRGPLAAAGRRRPPRVAAAARRRPHRPPS